MYIDDMGYDFDFENQFKEIGSCVDFSDMNEDNFDYIEDYLFEDFTRKN